MSSEMYVIPDLIRDPVKKESPEAMHYYWIPDRAGDDGHKEVL